MKPEPIATQYQTLAEGYAEWHARAGTLDHSHRLNRRLAPNSPTLDLGRGVGLQWVNDP